jgi:hypothetical protein
MIDGVDDMLSEQMPGERTSLERDTYYWYYATQVLRHVGGAMGAMEQSAASAAGQVPSDDR